MSSLSLIALCVLVVLTGKSIGQNAGIEDSLAWTDAQFKIAESVVMKKLPNTADALDDARDQLDTLKMALSHCDNELRSSRKVDVHRICVKVVFGAFYVSLDSLADETWAHYGATSGASRVGLF
ncbi:uncharacterized protein LOC108117191 [Drosophila eugracilis]|uniref:uncharacterized protein LOC108117191 n=1 Tax=Drosophila eugracilis TaxID=29029 RepID=UPI001BDAEDD6|nr:uncharacterized protein LOC108117191 [Drosophila eugracilis]